MNFMQEEEESSLFGSPPPSPGRGRSPSLALPSGSAGNTQNVGTIALPGSHNYSELAVSPIALSWNFPPEPPAQRPPAQSGHNATRDGLFVSANTSNQPSASSSAINAGDQPPGGRTSKKRKGKSTVAQIRVQDAPPPINLPDPGTPIPANFLRNQSALLGAAGIVGGVNPAKLPTRRSGRGTSPSDAILVDEVPFPPTNEQVIKTLISQKNVFPVLESILKMVSGGAQQPAQPAPRPWAKGRAISNDSSDEDSRPGKKRKLRDVPAGAADWDVPYPFPEGEGPESYRTNWERERGKELIAQLAGLINGAREKAAQKTLGKGKKGGDNINRYYRPRTATYGISKGVAKVRTSNPGRNTIGSNASSSSRASSVPLSETATPLNFDQIMASLDMVTSGDPFMSTGEVSRASDGVGTSRFDQAMYDNWLELLAAFPPPPPPDSQNGASSRSTSPISMQFHGDLLGTPMDTPSSLPNDFDALFPPFPNDPFADDVPNPPADSNIDPVLLALSNPSTTPSTSTAPPTPALIHSQSPIPSSSSWDHPTPSEATSDPIPFTFFDGALDTAFSNNILEPMASMIPEFTNKLYHRHSLSGAVQDGDVAMNLTESESEGTGFGSAVFGEAAQQTVELMGCMDLSPVTIGRPIPPLPKLQPIRSGPSRSNTSKINKEQVFEVARERKQRLEEQLLKAKVEIWEAQMEAMVLSKLAK